MTLKKSLIALACAFVIGTSAFAEGPFENNNTLGLVAVSKIGGDGAFYSGAEYARWLNKKVSVGVGGFTLLKPDEDSYDYEVYLTSEQDLLDLKWGSHNGSRLIVFETIGVRGFKKNLIGNDKHFENAVDAVFALGFGYDFLLADHLVIPLKVCCIGEAPESINLGLGFGIGLKYAF